MHSIIRTKVFFYIVSLLMAMNTYLFGSSSEVDELIHQLTSPNLQKRALAKKQLKRLYEQGNRDLLNSYLTSNRVDEKIAALEIAGLVRADSALIDLIAGNLTNGNEVVRYQAIKALSHISSSQSVSKLVQSLEGQEDQGFTIKVLEGLAAAGVGEGSDVVARYLDHEDLKVRYAAAKTLWVLKTKGVERAVVTASGQESDPQVKGFLLAYLVSQGNQAGHQLKKFVDVRDRQLRQLVIDAYTSAHDTSIIAVWSQTMVHESWRVRRDAARGFQALGQIQHVPELIRFLEDKHPVVRDEVAIALRKITKHQFGFQGHHDHESRQQAIQLWNKWWQDNAYRYDLTAQ